MENMMNMNNVAMAGGGLLLMIVGLVIQFVFYVAVMITGLYLARRWNII